MNRVCLLEHYLGQTSRGLLLVDDMGIVLFCNGNFLKLFCLDIQESLVERPFGDCLSILEQYVKVGRHDNQSIAEGVSRSHATGIPFTPADFFLAGRWLAVRGRTLEEGGYALTITDVTTHHTTMESLHRSSRITVMALAELAESRDQTTGDHVLRVARLTHAVTRKLMEQGLYGSILHEHFLQNIALASILHDIGKVTTPDRILLKPGALDAQERQIIQQHALMGWSLLKRLNDYLDDDSYLAMAEEIAKSHHENFNGSGYPDGLAGEEIPLSGRIVALADVYDALVSERPYKQAWSEAEAIGFVQKMSGQMFDPQIVDAFLAVLEDRQRSNRIVWTPDMTVGDRLLDFDHCNLIALLNQVYKSIEQRDVIMFNLVQQELFNYTIGHFAREEAYLLKMGYPDLQAHIRIHQALTRKVRDMRHRFLHEVNISTQQQIGDELLELLSGWLREHILHEDGKYYRFVSSLQPDEVDCVQPPHRPFS
ncbi:MAG: bacteriohemerythrin [Magnetococcales bacterium]|nr:bacteriohemerythrin [Magnetococcales bacterium]MBF0270949.1 bacteriohemerythrin [Magnetococcales bacterium]